jgi:hypothetical protein
MRTSRFVVLTLVATALLAVVAGFLPAAAVTMLLEAVALLAITGYAATAGRDAPPRVRWLPPAAIGLFAAAAAAGALPKAEYSDSPAQSVDIPSVLATTTQELAHRQIAATLILLGVTCLLWIAHSLPARSEVRDPKATAVATAGLVLVVPLLIGTAAIVWANLRGWGQVNPPDIVSFLGAASPALLAALAAALLVVVVLASGRTGPLRLLTTGSLLVAVAAATSLTDLAETWTGWQAMTDTSALTVSFSMLVETGDESPPDFDWSAAIWIATMLAGSALLAIGIPQAFRVGESPDHT